LDNKTRLRIGTERVPVVSQKRSNTRNIAARLRCDESFYDDFFHEFTGELFGK